MLKVVDKQTILVIKQVVIVETITATKEPTFAKIPFFFFYLGSLSRTFMIPKTTEEGEGYFFNFILPLLPLHRHLDISRAITAEDSPLHIVGSWTPIANSWFPSTSR